LRSAETGEHRVDSTPRQNGKTTSELIRAAENYRRTIIKHMNDDIFIHPTKAGEEYLADAELWKKTPR
jgi:hypothetical protein